MPPRLKLTSETLVTRAWADYALLDSGNGRKLERYGRHTVVRPEPQCFWSPRDAAAFDAADAVFDPTDEDETGRWRFAGNPIDSFPLAWRDVRFTSRFTPFRHLAFFPEQAANWEWLDGRIRRLNRPRVLNLFGYTGVASLACAAAAGAEVTHVDASKKSVAWARENAGLSGMTDRPIRWIVEDARKYVAREVRRGVKYDGIILDPPKYGRGPEGEVWQLERDLAPLIAGVRALVDDKSAFVFLTVYAIRLSALAIGELVQQAFGDLPGRVECGELGVREEARGLCLPTAIWARWVNSFGEAA